MEVKGRGITCLLVSSTVICLVATPGGRACPRRCACYVPTEVHCTFRYLTSIPDSISPNVERINLGYNSLVKLTETDFSGLNKLELLMLHSNGIHTIPAKTFSDLQALQVLKMSYNKVRKLQKDTFYGLRNLTRLHMDHNNIEFINPEVFYGLTFLRLVHLEGNRLTKLHPDTFVSLRYLQIFKISFIKYLYLSDNFLSTLPREMVSYMPDLESLYLHGNPWTCDCHLKWLSDWIQEKPDIIKCKKDRSPSSPQQCPLCTNPRTSEGKPLAMVPAAGFLCVKPTIDPSLKLKSLTILEDSGSVSISPQDFMAPFGSLILNMTDQSGNEANMVCSIQKPSRTSSIAFTEENDYIVLNTSFSTFLMCNIDYSHIQPVWQILALYSDSPLILERSDLLSKTPQLCYKYKQGAPKPEDIFTNIEAALRADPPWLMQDQISLQLNRTVTTLSTLQIHYSSDAQVTLPRAEIRPVKHKWTMISRDNNSKLERTVLVGGTIDLDCPGQGDPTPHLEWLLADGSKVRAPYVSEDGRILIDKSGKLELQMADSFDTGIYHCISTNYDDADILTYRITVVEPYIESYHKNGAHHTVFIGETLDLPCHSTGIPDASVSWVLPGNTVLYQSSREKQIFNNGTLRILQVTQKDQGHYCCIAANPSGVDLLINQVSVEIKGRRPMEHDVETDGSGLDESNPIVHLRDPPAAQLPTSDPMVGEAGKQVSSISKKHSYRELMHRRHGDSTNRRFREHRRQFPSSARRIDPRHWAALLEKVKKNTVPEKRENTTARPPPLVTQLLKIPGEEADSSGMFPLDEEFMALATEVPDVLARTMTASSRKRSDSPVTSIMTGTEVSPIRSPQMLPPEKAIGFKLSTTTKTTAQSKYLNSTTSSKMQGTNNPNLTTVFPLLPETTRLQDADGMGRRRQHLQSAPAITVGPVIEDVNTKILSSANGKADIFLGSENTMDGHQTSVTGGSEPRSNHFYPRSPQKLGTSRLPSGPHTAAHSQLQIPRNSTANIPLSRRFGKRRKVWGRGRIISSYRTPVLRRHRYGFVKTTVRESSKESATAFPAAQISAVCPSCSLREGLTTAAAALSFSSSFPFILPKVDIARVAAAESPTLVRNPSLLSENKPNVDIEKTTPTMKYFRAESTQVTPIGTVMTHASTSVSMEKTHIRNNGSPSVSNTSEAERDSVIISPLPGPTTKTSMPTTIAITTFSRKKIPWHQMFGNNYIQTERLKNQHKFGSQKSTATMLPKISNVSLFPFTMHSANVMQIPSVTLATTHHSRTETHNPMSLPTVKELPFPSPVYPTLPGILSKESSTNFISVQTATLTTLPTAPASISINKAQIARPRTQKVQSKKEPQKNRNAPNSFPHQSSGFTTSTAVILPVPTAARTSAKPSVSAFTQPSLENTKGISSTIDHYPRTLNRTDLIKEPPQESTQTLKSTTASETTLSSKLHQRTTTRNTTIRHSTVPPFLSSSASPMLIPTSPSLSNQNALTDHVATPIFQMTTNMAVKLHEPSKHNADPQQLAEKVAASSKVHPNAKFTTGTTYFMYSNLLHSTPMPALITVKPLNSKLTPLWSGNHFWHKSYPEIAEKGKKQGVSMLPTVGLPEDATHASNWDIQKTAKKSHFDKTLVQKITPELPTEPLSRNIFERPRLIGGKAASFTVPANSDAFLPCEAVGNPLPTIHWTRVSSGLDLSKRKRNDRFQVLPNGTLSIRRVDIQDRGQYLCSASNPFGTDRLHITLSVVSYPPRILERRTKEITVHSGSTVELKCRVEGRPSPTISWILANQTVVSESSTGNRQARVTADGTLVIHNISVYDRGFYKCMARNSAGQDSLLVKIQVIAAPPVILEQKRQVIVATWGENLKLPCTAKGTPQPSVHWVLSDGTEVKPLQFIDSKLFLFLNGTLYIKNIDSSNRGTYECIATSSTGSERRVVIITMEERETIPRIEFASQTWNEVNFGEKLLLNCSAIGEPKPQIIWRLPSKAVVDQWHRMGSRIHVYPNGSLFIGSITEKDGGDYLCVARNKMGDDLILMHVSLRLKPAKIDHGQHFKKQVFHGKDFQVDCKASGSPVPQISWSLPDGTMINNAMQADDSGHQIKRYTLFDNGTLYFNKVGIAEEGDYTCYAQNTLGKDEMKVHLTVITAAPRIRQGYRANTRIKAGDTAMLDCEVTGEPKPKTFWLLPSSDMISFSKDRYIFHANGSLSINKVKLLDSGEYVCVARNPSGYDTKMYKLDVVSKPPLINGLYTNKTVIKATAVRHSKKHLDCRAEGTPSPRIMWIMPDNIFLTAPYYGSRITVHKNGTLEIRNVRLSDSADFICVARNEGGESVLVVRLEVLEMLRRPTFRNPFNEKIVAQLGKSTALNCSVDGNPPPEIIWILPNGTRFPNEPQNSQYLIASNGSFIIYKMTRDDAGKYRCGARNKVGYIEKLIVLEIGQKPVILTDALGTVYCISGESLSLHCVSNGSPKPNVKWTVPSGFTVDRPQISGKYILYENGTLVIKEATAYDRGNYICKAQNSIGHALITVPVMVVAYPPRITNRPPRSVLTRTGAAVQLHCVALGIPKPEITWELPDHSLLSMANKGRTHGIGPLHPQGTLVIQNPQTSDSGIYKCTAKNPLGSDSATTYIQVI
ncbi:immunoglobulin superfamily member 10 [Rousettus aegyptiacus]|uniref:immunoglobulin superfamily member 10 n=1 Tax=Rousettus aegyptiacus TaxID=9407 RepID=UPI00168D38C1|nr:immunoglobulin superfamily member 10 [Rousettus aegyptiacus]XP_016011936.2 immunoglobulin superfamily member 10 [Rousettus aegyptiacus]KAF6474429.1 immunoglobulin superfamily member 10 [Rousettus aegyptiacus]